MLRLPYPAHSRLIPPLLLACMALPPAFCLPARADDTAAPAPAAAQGVAAQGVAAPAPDQASGEERQLRNDVDAYFHYGWIGRYDLASQFGQKIVDEASDPAALIPILEQTAKLHDPTMGYMAQILLFDNQPDLKDATDKLLLKVQAGNVARAQDPTLVEQMIRDMAANERAYENHLPFLRRSGEMAVPVILQFLRLEDDQHKPFRGAARRALVDLGRFAVNPLAAATEMKDQEVLLTVIDALGSLGYDEAAPYLARLAADNSAPEGVRNAANSALGRLQITPAQAADPANLFYNLAIRFYYGKADIAQTTDNPGPTAATPVQTRNYWTWDADKGLIRAEVPAPIFNDLMTMRACEQALTLKADLSPAVSLWLDADNKREADLPQGATDPIHGDQPPAHYFNVSSGAAHLNDALARALHDRNAAVSLKLTHSLGLIVGRSSLSGPLTDALRFPDKRVKFEAALAAAAALPAKPFAGQEAVVPLLVQAIGEGGGGNLLVLGPDRDDANALAQTLRGLGYVTAAAASPGEAIANSATLPSVDAIIIGRGVGGQAISRTIALARQTPQLADAVEVILSDSDTGAVAALALGDQQVSVSIQTDGDGLKKDIEAARSKAGLAPLDQAEADAYAMRGAVALERLAVSQNPVLDAGGSETGLLSALQGPRTELVAAIGNVLARLASPTAQQGLAERALDEQATPAVRTALFQSLTVSAKANGNLLTGPQVALLEKQAVELKDNDIRSAAAEARGALNLPTDQARDLILNQGGN